MKKTLLLLFLAVISLSPACKKSTQPDPCAGYADVTALVKMGIIFVDKSTGEYILTSKDIDPKKITITPSIEFSVNNIANSDFYGALVFLPQYKEGEFSYNINIPGKGTFTLAFTNVEKITGIPCHPSRVIVGEPSIQGYTVTRLDEHDPYVIKVTI